MARKRQIAESLVGSSSALSSEYAPDSARGKSSSIVDEPGEGWAFVRENQRRETGGF